MKRSIVLSIQRLFKLSILEKLLIRIIEKAPQIRLTRKFAPQNFEFSSGDIRICNRYGINYKLHPQDYQSWLLYFYCDYDSSFDVLKYSKKDYTIIDVGGNIGQTAMMMAKEVGENGKIISFEPYHRTYEYFRHNLSLNPDLKNITLEHIGLGESDTISYMVEECATNSGGNRIVNSEKEEIEGMAVQVIMLDEYLKNNNILKVDLIKIDVEGFEMKVLKGAKNTLRQNKPDLFI